MVRMHDRDVLQVSRAAASESASPAGLSGNAPRSEPVLVIRGLCKQFRDREVLRGVDLEVFRGEIVAVLGRNGAGKTTLLRILVGTVIGDAGEITLGGSDIRRHREAARAQISWVLGDEHGWYWRLTAHENLVFFAMLRGLDRRQAGLRASSELERQSLGGVGHTRVAELSTGMRARLALARASLVPGPVVVLDEPGRGLDAAAEEWLAEYLTSLTSSAVLLVTHDLEMVSRIAHRSLVLERGVVGDELPAGTPASTLATRIASETVL